MSEQAIDIVGYIIAGCMVFAVGLFIWMSYKHEKLLKMIVDYEHKQKKVKKKMLFPFKDKDTEKSFGFMFSILGVVLLMFGFSDPSYYFIKNFLSISLTGLIVFFIGLFYFVDSMS